MSGTFCLVNSHDIQRLGSISAEQRKWMHHVPVAEKNASRKVGKISVTATSCTTAEILTGRRIRRQLDLLLPNLSTRMAEKTRNADHSPGLGGTPLYGLYRYVCAAPKGRVFQPFWS